MTETRATYTSTGVNEWVPGLQGPQPLPEIVHVNGVKYIRADRCANCRRTCRGCAHWHFPCLDYFDGQTTFGRCDVRPDCFTDPMWGSECADWKPKE